ncbi:MAG TPA: hypothetical protein VHC20_06375, partial [Candidatus Paceibacterota bacterium]|nr:hypothetical protein [Candidatus Paceibacterota bacterium]
MKLGFTGTSRGATRAQLLTLRTWLLYPVELIKEATIREFHHGLCVGADEQAHRLARQRVHIWIVGHPPIKKHKLAKVDCDELRPEKDYLDRNQDIVDETDALIATPREEYEVLRSGTWSTIRRAVKARKPVYV